MKTKYKFINLSTIDDKIMTNYLQQQAAKGWMLHKIGLFFLKFRKEKPQYIKYFIDYRRPIPSYIHTLEQRGYHFIDNYQIINIFYSRDIDKEPIEKDTVIATQKKNLYHPSIMIILVLSGFILFYLCDVLGLSIYLYISKNHILLYFNQGITYLMFKFISVFLICQGFFYWLLRFKCYRESHNQKIADGLFHFISTVSHLFDVITFIIVIIFIVIHSLNQPFLILSFIIFFSLFYTFSYYINKKIIKIENKTKRILLTIATLLIFIITYQIPFILPHHDHTTQLNNYQNATNNYKDISRTLIYRHETYYGNDNEKNEFDEYINTYREDIYYCLNQDIAKSIFAALTINMDHERRIPNVQEIDSITEAKGSFDSLKDVPFYNYEKSAMNLTNYHDHTYDLCYGYDNRYIVLKENIVFDLQLKDNTSLSQLVTYYSNRYSNYNLP